MELDPTAIAAASVSAFVSDYNIAARPDLNPLAQQRWTELAVWGLLAAACRWRSYRNAADETNDLGKETPEEDSSRQNQHAPTVVALLLVSSQYATLSFGRASLEFLFPFIPLFVALFKSAKLNRSTESSTWRSRLVRHVDGFPNIVLLFGMGVVLSLALYLCVLLVTHEVQGMCVTTFTVALCVTTATAYSYVAIGRQTHRIEDYDCLAAPQNLQFVQDMSTRAFVFCSIYLAMFSIRMPSYLSPIAIIGIASRLGQIYTILAFCFNNAPMSAAAVMTPAAAISSAFLNAAAVHELSPTIVLLTIAAVCVTFLNLTLPKPKGWTPLYFLLALPVVMFLAVFLFAGSPSSNISLGPIHPIKTLVESNQNAFNYMVASQSQTLHAAVAEYKRRYRRSPPPGFDKWFEIAQQKDFQLIDEFDVIMETLEPFWGLSPASLRERVESVEKQDAMIGIQVNSSGLTYAQGHHYAKALKEWGKPEVWGEILPDVKFVISSFDEPRVVAPYDAVERAMAYARKLVLTDEYAVDMNDYLTTNNEIKWMNIGKQGTFEGMVSSCHINSPARSGRMTKSGMGAVQLPFVENVTTTMEVCASDDLLHGHGLLAAPDTMILTHSLVPIFSQCKPSVFSDILYPSPYYWLDSEFPADQDKPWDEKLDRLYWAGSSTGGFNTLENWQKLHRSRITIMTEPESEAPVQLLDRDENNNWQPRNTTYKAISDLFHTRITRIVQCAKEACDAMKERFIKSSSEGRDEPNTAPLGSKYALDIDGNAYSGQYYKLLKSNSAVLKHTSFKEWHDGRLQPWVHFIPISPGAEELGEVMRYLVHEEEGREIGRRIAEEGREWARRTLRREDLEVVFVRVLLEYGRIMSEGREGMVG